MSYSLSVGENSKRVVNFYTSSASKIVGAVSEERSAITFKAGSFILNGKQIRIESSDTLQSIVKKINKSSAQTGINAKVEKNIKGHKLHLFSKKSTVEIQDHSGVLAKLYNNGCIGTASKHLMQFTSRVGSGAVTILYNKSAEAHYSGLSVLAQLAAIKIPTPIGNSLVVLNELPIVEEDEVNIPDHVALEDDVPEIVERGLDYNIDENRFNEIDLEEKVIEDLPVREINDGVNIINDVKDNVKDDVKDDKNLSSNKKWLFGSASSFYNRALSFVNRSGAYVSKKIFNIDDIKLDDLKL